MAKRKDIMKPEPVANISDKMTLAEFSGRDTGTIKNGFGYQKPVTDRLAQFGGKLPPFSRAELIKRGYIKK